MSSRHRRPLHQRLPFVGWLRERLRSAYFSTLRKTVATDDGKSAIAGIVRGLSQSLPEAVKQLDRSSLAPYPELERPAQEQQPGDHPRQRRDVVLLTSRFRTGSTLLWQLFRAIPDCVSYYEPLNERRWFDPASRGDWTDPTHRGAEDYWKEYEGFEDLSKHFQESWSWNQFLMEADFWEPRLLSYLEELIRRTAERPVLQFNRMDFRLPWLKAHFPNAKLIHLYRHPRDQWCSFLKDIRSHTKDQSLADFGIKDRFYLRRWCRDLRHQFPFLEEREVHHLYELFYYLWKLSYWFGITYADYSVAFEKLAQDPQSCLPPLLEAAGLGHVDTEPLVGLISPPSFGKWRDYASHEWFCEREWRCERVLEEFFAGVDRRPVQQAADPSSVLHSRSTGQRIG